MESEAVWEIEYESFVQHYSLDGRSSWLNNLAQLLEDVRDNDDVFEKYYFANTVR